MLRNYNLIFFLLFPMIAMTQNQKRLRDYGITPGVLPTGQLNSITDVEGVRVGHTTIIRGDSVRTGVTAIIPYEGNVFQQKVPAAVFVANGFGKLAGSTQVNELGNLETPVILTNTLSVGTAMNAVIKYTLRQKGNEQVRSVNALVGETNDGYLNDIRGMHVTEKDVLDAIKKATTNNISEGNIGAGTGTVCFGFKGGIGTSSRKLPASLGGYTVGVLVQTNFGGVLEIDGLPVGKLLNKFSFSSELLKSADGSCMVVVATDAPLDHRNLYRLAKRAFLGIGKTGGIASNGSGDYVIAFSTATGLRVPYTSHDSLLQNNLVSNDNMSAIFMASIEATEEAIWNSLFAAQTITGINGHKAESLPVEKVVSMWQDAHKKLE